MEISDRIEGVHGTISSCGRLMAYLSGRLRIATVQAPERFVEFTSRIPFKNVTALKWSPDSTNIAICSNGVVEILDLDDPDHRVRLDNGSGGLGHFRSADFIGNEKVLIVWEFGNARIWDLQTGKGSDVPDFKTSMNTPAWQLRPSNTKERPPIIAALSRQNGEDMLAMHFAGLQIKSTAPQKVPGDTRSMSWSPDGRWLVMNGSPYTSPCTHIYTADGHHFKAIDSNDKALDSNPKRKWEDHLGIIGIKEILWSPDSQLLALTRYNGSIPLLNTRTFSPLAIIEHFTTVDQSNLPPETQATVYEETVSASNERSYTRATHPISPPLSDKSGIADQQGVAETRFSCDGAYLATRDARMQSTVWIWNVARLAAQAVLIQHTNVRRMGWHPSRPDLLMLDCGEGIAYFFDVTSMGPPQPVQVSLMGNVTFAWIPTLENLAILATTRSAMRIIYPEGRSEEHDMASPNHNSNNADAEPEDVPPFEEGASEDSLLDMLSGRKPLPVPSSYTQLVDLEADEADMDMGDGLDDTFREKRKPTEVEEEIDPLDDSQIF